MLKVAGWESLTETERLVLLSMSLELNQVEGLEVRYYDICLTSGIDCDKLHSTLEQLSSKGLVEINRPGDGDSNTSASFAGNARTFSLMGDKAII